MILEYLRPLVILTFLSPLHPSLATHTQSPEPPSARLTHVDIPIQFIQSYKTINPPDYQAIKKTNDDRVAQQQREAEARQAAQEAAQAAQQAQVIQSAPPVQATPQTAPQPATSAPVAVGSLTDWMAAAGVSPGDYQYMINIVMRESGGRWWAQEPNSGAYGLCQALPAGKMASAGPDYLTNPVTQVKWCNSYAQSRYGGWANAWAWWQSHNWW